MPRLMFLLMYGAGLRHKECRRLRVKDVCFDQKHVVVRNDKGEKDRITFLPEQAVIGLRQQIEEAKRLHRIDVEEGFEQVYMPNALAKKYPSACKEAAWKWVFPSQRRSIDKRTGKVWRHHISRREGKSREAVAGNNLGPHSRRRCVVQRSTRTEFRILCGTALRRIWSNQAPMSKQFRS